MNQGPLIFLGVFFTLASSWVGMILAPQLQFGKQQAVEVKDVGLYPAARPGLAQQGAAVYRANGCVYCHTQRTRQTDLQFSIVLVNAGTNRTAVAKVIADIRKENTTEARKYIAGAPAYVKEGIVTLKEAQANLKALETAGAKAELNYRTLGPDIERHWGKRATVAQDYLYDEPPMIGEQRIGPDLANVGLRRPNRTWQLWHLYNPRLGDDSQSIMPAYPFLFKVQAQRDPNKPSADSLKLPGEYAPKKGYEVVPKPEAVALVAYLMSLQSNESLEEAPAPKDIPTGNAPN